MISLYTQKVVSESGRAHWPDLWEKTRRHMRDGSPAQMVHSRRRAEIRDETTLSDPWSDRSPDRVQIKKN